MKIKEIVNELVAAENYAEARLRMPESDGVIELIKDHIPVYWDLLKEKEEIFQEVCNLLGNSCKNAEL